MRIIFFVIFAALFVAVMAWAARTMGKLPRKNGRYYDDLDDYARWSHLDD